ncbi:hypothetical protein ASD28_22945 [Massilia sp. Root133]|nr:hypothetical protein ASD28_22945 [Massilia sp. Root133]KQZ44456.1 hypothetical protein ASD92_28310 [Massilia sp. Root1485]
MSPVSYLVAFVIMLGWEGPLCAYVGILHQSMVEVLAGAAITLFIWGLFGWWALVDVAKISAKKISR